METKHVKLMIDKMNAFAYNNGEDLNRIFESWLDFVLHGVTLNAPVKEDWKFKGKENEFFYELYADWIKAMSEQLNGSTLWCDLLGDVYMQINSSAKAQQTGQFFTPSHICDFMQAITQNKTDQIGKQVCDPCCGSGRNLLSFHTHNLGNYVFGMDIDLLCCKMTVLNFWIHGCIGEVVCINTLTFQNFNGCWQVERQENGFPAVKLVDEKHSIIMSSNKQASKEHIKLIPLQQSLF